MINKNGFLECICTSVAQVCPTLCDPVNCSPPGSSAYGIFQGRILGQVASSLSRASSWPRDWNHVSWLSCFAGRFFTIWAIREARGEKRPFVFLKAFNIYSCLVYSEYVEGTGSSGQREDWTVKVPMVPLQTLRFYSSPFVWASAPSSFYRHSLLFVLIAFSIIYIWVILILKMVWGIEYWT